MELTSFDYTLLVHEWQRLVGARIQKIYGKDDVLLFDLFTGKRELLLFTGKVVTLTTATISWPKTPSGYVMFLRRRIQGGRITAIEQLGGDRVLKFTVKAGEHTLTFIAEVLGELNTLVIDETGKILSVQTAKRYSDRAVRGGVTYEPPPPKEQPATLVGLPTGKTLATAFGLARRWADEVCAQLSLDASAPLTEGALAKVEALLHEKRTVQFEPVYSEKNAFPFPFLTAPDATSRAETFSAALDAVLKPSLAEEQHIDATQHTTVRLTKQEKILAAQREQLTKLTLQAQEKQREGEVLYEYYTELTALLADVAAALKKAPLHEVKEQFKTHPLVQEITADAITVKLPQ